MSLVRIARAILVLVLFATPARAQTSPERPSLTASPDLAASPAPGAAASPSATTESNPAASGGLLGDFGDGERSKLRQRGLSLDGHLTTEFAANLSGGIPLGGRAYQRGTALSTEFGFGFDADFNAIVAGSGAGILHFLMTTRFGSNLSSQAIGNVVSVQEIYGDGQTTRITYLDYEQPLFEKRLDLRIGKYNQQGDFIAGSTYWGGNLYCYYQNNNICGTPAGIPNNNGVVSNGSEGYVYYPSSQWGARLKANVTDDLYVQAAAIQANPIVNNPDGGLYLGLNGGVGTEFPLEVGVTLKNRTGHLTGNVRLGGYYDTSNVADYASRAKGSLALAPFETSGAGSASNAAALATIATNRIRGRSGAYVQMDHMLEGGSGKDKPGTAFFASFEYSDPRTSIFSTMLDVGVVRHGTFRGRNADTIAVGFASDAYNVRLRRLEDALQHKGFAVPSTGHEQVIELTYGYRASSWFVLRPGLQLVVDPGGVKPEAAVGVLNPARNALVIGLGGYVSL